MKSSLVSLACYLLFAHALADMVVLFGPRGSPGSPVWLSLILFSIPIGQASLLAIWAAMSSVRSYVRFPLALAGITWMFFLVTWTLNYDILQEHSALMAMMLATQAVTIFLVVGTARVIWGIIRHRRCERTAPAAQYSIASLLLWTTLLAVTLGTLKLACMRLGWSESVVNDRFFAFTSTVGVYNAVLAILVLATLTNGLRWWLDFLVAIPAALVLAGSECFVLQLIFHTNGGMTVGEWIVLDGLQILSIYATLLPLRLCRHLGSGRVT